MKHTLGRWACLIVLMMGALSFHAVAQEADQEESTEQPRAGQQIDPEELEQLIITLESEMARQAFIENLKTLLEAHEQETANGPSMTLGEWLNVDETGNSLAKAYIELLKSLGFTDSKMGQLVTLVLATLVLGGLALVNHKLATVFNRKLSPFRDRLNLSRRRFSYYFKIQKWFGYIFAILLLLYAGNEIYGFWPASWENGFGLGNFLVYALSLLVTVLVFISVWEWVNFLLEYGSYRNPRFTEARVQTLMPIVRNLLLFTLIIMAVMTFMSELGIDIVPLLAGAGVVGIAVGFGAQTLVKDFITGFIVILEDLLQVGDVVRLGNHIGVVERITIRKIQLRDLDGTVYTVPFNEVSVVENLTKEFSYYLMEVGVAYRENTDEVVACLREVDEELRNDEDFGPKILEPLQVLGVDRFADSSVVIRARIKTIAHDKWYVGREYNRRLKFAFDERGIEIPFPHQTLYFGVDKDGDAPKGNLRLFKGDDDASGEEKIKAYDGQTSDSQAHPDAETAETVGQPTTDTDTGDGGDR